MDVEEARTRLTSLQNLLRELVQRDPDQEVRGIAVPVLDAVINQTRTLAKPDDSIAAAIKDLIDPDAVAAGDMEDVRASDALFVVDQLIHSLPPAPSPVPIVVRDEGITNWWDVKF